MNNKIELLAPGGDLDSIKAAIVAGANAIYCGLARFNARNRAENIALDDLNGIVRLAHAHGCEVFLTLNIIILESEIPAIFSVLNRLSNTQIDGVIVQDLGMLYLLAQYFPGLPVHASTQLTTHNDGQIHFLARLHAERVNLSRELSLDEIRALTATSHRAGLLTEVFVHGSYCLSFSGICYLSSVLGGNSGNRGRCSQPCRDQYQTTAKGKNFPLNLKDNSAYADLKELVSAGVDSIKIEGRMKQFHYVYTVVKAFRKQLQSLYRRDALKTESNALHTVFNRNFSNAFLQADINRGMFIDNPRDNSALHLAEKKGGPTAANIKQAKRELYDTKTAIRQHVQELIAPLDIAQAPLTITVSGQAGTPLQIHVQSPNSSFALSSDHSLVKTQALSHRKALAPGKDKGSQGLNAEALWKRLKPVNSTAYFIDHLDTEKLPPDLFLSFQDLTILRNKIITALNGSQEPVAPIEVPDLPKPPPLNRPPTLSVLIASRRDLSLRDGQSVKIYYQLPNAIKDELSDLLKLFGDNRLTPWFPAVLIGENYQAAVRFLEQAQPNRIVTNNTGIAYEACKRGIPWIAGPCLNIINSFSLRCVQEHFNCSGAFISNEINRKQIKRITRPDNFKLYYSIYHPIVLLTSRQCLLHQVEGCRKAAMDEQCLPGCERSTSIRHLDQTPLYIGKKRGSYHSLYNDANFLNTDIVTDLPNVFSGFFIDLRDIPTSTETQLNKAEIVTLFRNHLLGMPGSAEQLRQGIAPTTDSQYRKGI